MKKYIYAAIVAVVVLLGYYAVNAIFTKTYDIPTTVVQKKELLISINENGTIDAVQAKTISAPRVRGLQVTWLAPEGTTVKAGDPVVKFDASQQLADVAENESQLKIKQNSLERATKEYTIQEKQLTLDLEKAKRNYDEKKHDAPRIAEEAKMEYELAELNFDAKLEQLKADVEKAKVEVQRAQDKLDIAQKELDQTTLYTTIPGLVVYLEIWKGGTMEKVQEGDSPWPGQGLINIPDLSEMMVKTTVSEVDAAQVDTGQMVNIRLDAVPGVLFHGKVMKKSTLARKKETDSKINVFDVEIKIANVDERLKPGMSASVEIVVDRIPDVVTAPLEAVFEKEGKTVVFLKNKNEQQVTIGQKNDFEIEIKEGLEPGTEICLLDPTLDEAGLPGDKATQPEINKDKSQQPKPPSGERGSRRGNRGR